MKHILIVLASVATLSATAVPASAQVYSVADILPPHEITAIVRQAGMQPISRPMWRPGRYIVHALDRYGRELRVVVDARMGEVIRAVPVGSYADVGPRGGYEPYQPRPYYGPRSEPYSPGAYSPPHPSGDEAYEEMDDGDLPPPSAAPRVIPGPRSAAPSPSRSAALPTKPAAPKSAPMPRSRPADAVASANPAAAPSAPAPAAKSSAEADSKKEVRMIDMSKPKAAETGTSETKAVPAETTTQETKPSTPEAKPLDDASTPPRF